MLQPIKPFWNDFTSDPFVKCYRGYEADTLLDVISNYDLLTQFSEQQIQHQEWAPSKNQLERDEEYFTLCRSAIKRGERYYSNTNVITPVHDIFITDVLVIQRPHFKALSFALNDCLGNALPAIAYQKKEHFQPEILKELAKADYFQRFEVTFTVKPISHYQSPTGEPLKSRLPGVIVFSIYPEQPPEETSIPASSPTEGILVEI